MADAGFESATTCVRSPATDADDPLTLPRKAISFGDNLIGYFWRLHVKNTSKVPVIRREGMSFAARGVAVATAGAGPVGS